MLTYGLEALREALCAYAQDTVRAPENKPMRRAVGVSVVVTSFFYISIGVFGCVGLLCWLAPPGGAHGM